MGMKRRVFLGSMILQMTRTEHPRSGCAWRWLWGPGHRTPSPLRIQALDTQSCEPQHVGVHHAVLPSRAGQGSPWPEFHLLSGREAADPTLRKTEEQCEHTTCKQCPPVSSDCPLSGLCSPDLHASQAVTINGQQCSRERPGAEIPRSFHEEPASPPLLGALGLQPQSSHAHPVPRCWPPSPAAAHRRARSGYPSPTTQ